MAQAQPCPIYLLITDLAASNPRDFKIPRFSSLNTKLSLHHVAFTKHWAIHVRDRCYEVNSRPSAANPKKRDYFLNHQVTFSHWKRKADEEDLEYEQVEVGATTWADQDIETHSQLIWDDRFEKNFKLDRQNCQNFSYLLYKAIALEPGKIKKDIQGSFKRMPNRFSEIAHFAKTTITSGIARAVLFELATDVAIFGAELIGIESLVGLEILGLELAGVALLGPIGEIIFAVTVIAFILKKSRDKKWLSKLKKLTKKDKMALENENAEVLSERALNEPANLELVLTEMAEEVRLHGVHEAKSLAVAEIEYTTSEPKLLPATKEITPDLRAKLNFGMPEPGEPSPPPPPYRPLDSGRSRRIPPIPTCQPPLPETIEASPLPSSPLIRRKPVPGRG